jgi:hypothetical protein
VCLHALNLLFVLYYHHVYEIGRSSETVILGPAFSHKKFSSYYYDTLLVAVKPENQKNIVTYFVLFWFCKLASFWCLTTIVSWGHKAVCLLLQVA